MIINDSININEKSKYSKPYPLKNGETWKTMKGTHIVVDNNGNIKKGYNPNKNKSSANKSSSSKKSKSNNNEPPKWATKIANAISKSADFINNNVHPFRR